MLRSIHFLIFILLCIYCGGVFAQDLESQNRQEAIVDAGPTLEQKLLELRQTLLDKEKEKKALELALKSESDELKQTQIKQELNAANDIIKGVREEIVQLATGGTKLYDEPPVVKQDVSWEEDLERIFEPLLEQLREVSERPRLIEELKTEIAYWESRKELLSQAVANLEQSITEIDNRSLRKELGELLKTAKSRYNSAQQKLSLLNNELLVLENAKNPIWSTIGEIITGVFIEMILHLLTALLAAFLVYQVARLFSWLILGLVKKSKSKDNVYLERMIEMTRTFVGFVFAFLAYLVVLYTMTEWLLLVFSLLIIAGLALGLKEALPIFIIEIKTLLNFGSIRQGERLVFHGLPWRITRLNVLTTLHNPSLHGHLRVPLTKIMNLSSRLYHKDEPWFPTIVGDYIKLEDGVFGKVQRQTPDIVEIDFGESTYTYQTLEFLSRRPRNLSKKGFTIHEVFGVDYNHQKSVTHSILSSYKLGIEKAIESSDYAEHCTSLFVEFDNASASSLDFRILATFNGAVASEYFRIKRMLQKASVELANREGWIIPFQQLTVHSSETSVK